MMLEWLEGVRVRSKSDSFVMRSIGWSLSFFNPSFMTRFWTTWFGTIYAPTNVDVSDEVSLAAHRSVIEHEKVHLSDQSRHPLLYPLSYVFPPFFFAYGRWYWERRAYLKTLSLIDTHERRLVRMESIVNSLGGSNYLWTWPRSWMREWFLEQLELMNDGGS